MCQNEKKTQINIESKDQNKTTLCEQTQQLKTRLIALILSIIFINAEKYLDYKYNQGFREQM